MNLLVLAAETENPLVPPIPELVIGLIAFVIVFGFLAKKLLPNINKVLDERREAIEGGIEKAEAAQTEAQSVLEQYKAQLAEARHEAARLRQEALEQGTALKEELRAEGQRQREEIIAATTPRSRPTARLPRSRCVRTWASSPPTWPESSSASPSRTTPGRAARSTVSSASLRRRPRPRDERSEPRGAGLRA